ncbi:glucuronate isomerase [Schlesneria sp.]|uniref:glucuronate isomerase n=1 Tax=Schlesneria sp. TaxID=2762018 RepID=UPI002EDC253F
MSEELVGRICAELTKLVLVDPHTHINPHAPASTTLADIMGYHYYTELAHSSGMPKALIEEPGLDPKTKVGRLVESLHHLDNTVQVSWLVELCRKFFGFQDNRITPANWESLYDKAATVMAQPDWEDQCLKQSGIERVFLTNEFDDPLTGFDTARYIPCLRTDDLVFHFTNPAVRERLTKATGIETTNPERIRQAIGKLFEHFVRHGAKACAISLPPSFAPCKPLSDELIDTNFRTSFLDPDSTTKDVGQNFVFWTIAEFCAEYRLPFDLMIGVNRRVYPSGVYQGQDLFDQRVSLIQYRELFNAFPQVTFPVSVLAQASNQELVSYSWIFPNVVTNAHWWYSNIPAYIELDTRARLQAVPRNKQVGYYSDMYKLEFAWPKFSMYRECLSRVLAQDFVIARKWSENDAILLGKQVLRGNVESIFNA